MTTRKHWIQLGVACLVFATASYSQDSIRNNPLTIEQVCRLALENSVRLKADRTNTDLAIQQTGVQRLGHLPTVSANLTYGYLSDAQVWTPGFSHHLTVGQPYPLTLFSVGATEVLFAGGRINDAIRLATLEEKIVFLRQQKDEVDIKFLVISEYLDIFRLLNQRTVYIDNSLLAKQRLGNILSLRKQGMVTLNDQLRTELTISDYDLTIRKLANSIIAINNQLNMVLGLPDSSRLMPDTSLLHQENPAKTLEQWLATGLRQNQDLKISAHKVDAAATRLKTLKGERLPEVLLLAESDLQRPFLNTIPTIDVYYNIWRAGVGIRYNISSIYQSPRKIKAGIIGLNLARQEDSLQRQDLEVAVKNALIQYNQAQDDLRTFRSDLRSAEENYRLVEHRYFNQLALLTDLIDATNSKTEAEIKVKDAEINILFHYYQLLKTIGTL